jgi:hypothetical protein
VDDEKYTVWRWLVEGLVFLVVVAGVVWACKLGCQNRQAKVSTPSPVTCPACGAKLELKEAGK